MPPPPNPHRVIQLRRGTTESNDALLGAEGEVTVDLDEKTLRVHDGILVGGFSLQRQEVPEIRYLTFRAGIVQQGIPSLGFSAPENSPTAVASYYGDLIVGAAEFDQNANQSVQDYIEMPTAWTGVVGLDVIWTTALTAGSVSWQIETCSAPIGSIFGSGTFINPILLSSETSDTPEQHLIASIDDIGFETFEGNGKVFFRFSRISNDTANGPALLLGLRFRIPVLNT